MFFAPFFDQFYIVSFFLLLFTFFIGSACFTNIRQIFVLRRGVITERGMYKKRAIQALQFCTVLNFPLFLYTAYEICFPKLFLFLVIKFYTLLMFLPIFLGLSSIGALFWINALKKQQEKSVSWFWALFCAFVNLKAFSIMIILSYHFFYCPQISNIQFFLAEPDIFYPVVAFYNKFANFTYPFLQNPQQLIFMIFFFLVSSSTLAYALQLLNTLLCRKIDDFGRDYYSQTISLLSRNAFRSCFFLCLVILVPILSPFLDYQIINFPLTETALALLVFPLTLISFIIIALSKNPLRHKITIFLSPLFILSGSLFFIFQTLINK